MTHNKKWVFSELVKDSNDLSQLIAYAIYKADKDGVANGLRAQGKTEAEIQVKLDSYHDSVATTLRLQQSCRDRAEALMITVVKGIADKTNKQAEQQIKAINDENKKALEKAGTKAVDEYHKKIKKDVLEKQSKSAWWWSFTISGFSGVWATIVLIIIVWIISMAAAPESERNHLTGSLFNRMWNYATSSPLPDSESDIGIGKDTSRIVTSPPQKP
ncbi:hypothetical protein [Lelliottia wanjuensis]|uniref:Uncharacterized protein n=1 Tax=Lelliottia wanjuensis TaxID=3050585 RepID=A0AAP4D4R6_9ENTR|nr:MULTISPECIES: hypothetical protein [unclassified Lelliottia]MDK9364155.1 hypothetical protein [Lelliottia sp. V106_12]MDK9585398.1 hypothetical protein [Lelliottia sp. V86_10]MDK9617168.1 hypothetical protein [Lelliottia sp. V106_9]